MARQQSSPKKNKGKIIAPVAAKKEKVKIKARPDQAMTLWMIVLVLVLPVLYTDKTMDPDIPVRYIFITVFLLLFILYFFVLRKKISVFPLPLPVKIVFGAGAAYALWSIVSAMGALNPREGYYEISRQLLNIIFLFTVMIMIIKEEPSVLKLCKALVLVAIIQSVIGIFQYYDLGFTNIPGDPARPYGMMANRNLYGSAQALLMPFCVFVLYKAATSWKYISGIALAGLSSSVFLSQTRSSWLSTIAIMIVSFVLVSIFSKPNRKKWAIGTLIAAISIAILVFLIFSLDTEGDLRQSTIERTRSLAPGGISANDHSVENAQERIRMWKKTFLLIKDKPITGAGPGNWRITIPKYGSEGMSWYYGQYTPDRPHNVYLLVTSETGIPGALLYFGMWLMIVILGFKVIRKPRSEDQRILVILMLAGGAALACDCMFSFPTERFEHSLYIYLMAGIILGIYANNEAQDRPISASLKKPLLWLGITILLFNLFLGFTKYKFETHFKQANYYQSQQQWQKEVDEVRAGENNFITLGPDVSTPIQIKSAIAYKELKEYDKALHDIKIAERYHPYNSRSYSTEGTIYTEQQQYDKAIACYLRGLQINPMYDVLLKNLAINYFLTNNFKGCIETIVKLNIPGDKQYNDLMNDAKQKLAADSVGSRQPGSKQ